VGESVIQRTFAGGELAPALAARADVAKYQQGLRTCRNFIVQRHGGVANRAGFRFVQACKTTSITVQLLRYVSEVVDESLLIEQGVGYLRFFRSGAALTVDIDDVGAYDNATAYVQGDLVSSGGVIYYAKQDTTGHAPPNATYWHPFTGGAYELPAPFTHVMRWVQSGRIITFTHKDEAPYELVFLTLTRWILRPITTAPTIPAPTGVSVTPGGAGSLTYGYVVTAGAADTYEESPASAQVISGSVAAPTADDPHLIEWDAVAGAVEYYIYADPYQNGTYGFIGTATGATEFRDTGITPDFAITPPVPRVLFDAADGYPHIAAYYQQRRLFAYTNDEPDSVWGSRTGFYSNFGISSPLQDDDSITFRIAGNNHNPVRQLVALKQLIVMTDSGEWTVGEPRVPLTPSNLGADQETYVGVADVRPVIVGNSILYVQARGSIVRDLRFDQEVEGLAGRDLSIFGAHLFDGYAIKDLDYQQTPHSIVWAARSDGVLLGLTYLRDQDIWGWHRHDTGASGKFEHVCVVPEPLEDALYVIVKRTINGSVARYIERLERRPLLAATFDADAFFVDSGLSYSGAAVSSVSGLGHLEGQTVAVLGDGTPLGTFVVAAGAITLPAAHSEIHVGLPITSEFEPLDLDVQGSSIRDRKKRIGSITVLLEASSRRFSAGPDSAHLSAVQLEPWESAVDQFTGSVELNITAEYNQHGRVFIRQTDPLPLTILGVIPNVEVGG